MERTETLGLGSTSTASNHLVDLLKMDVLGSHPHLASGPGGRNGDDSAF